jgi:hypothetical protein
MSEHISSRIALPTKNAALRSRLPEWVMCGMASTRSVRLLYPRIADYLVALPSTVKVCQQRL